MDKIMEKTNNIIIYSKENCKYCTMSKNLLKDIKLNFAEIKLDPIENDYKQRRDLLFTKYHESFPIILINDIFIGGYSELYKLYVSGELVDDESF